MKCIRFLIALFALFAFCDGNVSAATNELVYSGYVTDADGAALSGAHDVTVSLYTVATDGTAVWTEDQADLDFSDGFFTVALGSDDANPLPAFGDDLYLGISIDGDTEMTPRNEFFGSVRALSLADTVLGSALTWTGDQTFGNVIADDIDATTGNIDTLTSAAATITNLTVTSCTGCGSGGGASIDSSDTDDSVATASGTVVLYTQTVAGGTLANDGSVLHVKAWGTVNANMSGEQDISIKIGSTVLATTQKGFSGPAGTWRLEADIIRVNATSVKAIGEGIILDGTTTVTATMASDPITVTLASDFDIVVDVEASSGSTDATAEAVYVEHVP